MGNGLSICVQTSFALPDEYGESESAGLKTFRLVVLLAVAGFAHLLLEEVSGSLDIVDHAVEQVQPHGSDKQACDAVRDEWHAEWRQHKRCSDSADSLLDHFSAVFDFVSQQQ